MDIQDYIKNIPDFPTPGVHFKDISPILENPEVFGGCIETLKQYTAGCEAIIGIDARGFIFGSALANIIKVPFIMARKPGKLPGEILCCDYGLEYGKNTLCIQKNDIYKGMNIAIIDDVLATGGTAEAVVKLVTQLGATVHSLNFIIELEFLNGKAKLKNHNINSITRYPS